MLEQRLQHYAQHKTLWQQSAAQYISQFEQHRIHMEYDIVCTEFDMGELRRQRSGSNLSGSVGSETPDRLPGRNATRSKKHDHIGGISAT